MSASWAAVLVSVIIAGAALARELLHRGERDGKIDAILAQLTAITGDHENMASPPNYPTSGKTLAQTQACLDGLVASMINRKLVT